MGIISGFLKTKKYRKTENGYQLQSEWTSAQTVEMNDGTPSKLSLKILPKTEIISSLSIGLAK